jgi:hypothetical protein
LLELRLSELRSLPGNRLDLLWLDLLGLGLRGLQELGLLDALCVRPRRLGGLYLWLLWLLWLLCELLLWLLCELLLWLLCELLLWLLRARVLGRLPRELCLWRERRLAFRDRPPGLELRLLALCLELRLLDGLIRCGLELRLLALLGLELWLLHVLFARVRLWLLAREIAGLIFGDTPRIVGVLCPRRLRWRPGSSYVWLVALLLHGLPPVPVRSRNHRRLQRLRG